MEQKTRLDYIDIAKGIGMILVYVGHCKIQGSSPLFQWIYSFHMPLFFFLSGLLFKRKKFRIVIINKTLGLIVPYVLFSVINYFLYTISGTSEISIVGVILYGWGLNPMWFIPILFVIEMFHTSWVCQRRLWLRCATLLLMVTLFILKIKTNFFAPYAASEIPWFYLCFLTGYFSKTIIEDWIHKMSNFYFAFFVIQILLLFGLVLPYNDNYRCQDNDVLSYVYRYALGILGTLIVLLVSQKLAHYKKSFLFRFIGRNTIVLLCTHKMFYDILEKYNPQTFLHGGYNHIVVVVLCAISIWIYNKNIGSKINLLKVKYGK